jgi:phage-related minor tail protein
MKDVTAAYDDQSRAIRGAEGGMDGFIAGMEQAFAESSRINQSFEIGKQFVDTLSEAIGELATGAEVDFGRILQSFLSMIIQMEARAAMSAIWKSVGGFSGIAGALGSLFGSGGDGVSEALKGGIGAGGQILAFADGGRPPSGRASLVGERGPELFVPDSAGTIFNRDQIAGMSGGQPIIVQQTNHFGSDVSRAEMNKWAAVVEARAREGATSAIIGMRRAGDPRVKGVF